VQRKSVNHDKEEPTRVTGWIDGGGNSLKSRMEL
jgi:hypothetical protein